MRKLLHKPTEENGVSPVVGVMLMLVVTIIIAAVVASFAGGLADSQEKTPNALISGAYSQADGLVLTHNGGDTLHTNAVTVSVRWTEDLSGSSYMVWTLDPATIATKFPGPNAPSTSSADKTWKYLSTSSGLYWTGASTFGVGDTVYVNPAVIQPNGDGVSPVTSYYSFNTSTNIGKRFTVEIQTLEGTKIASTDVIIKA